MSATLPVRVLVHDVWDEVALDLPPDTPLADMKRRALELSKVDGDPNSYVVKYRGAEILDEQRTLAQSGVVRNAALIVLRKRRRPVR